MNVSASTDHPGASPILRFFATEHLPEGVLRNTSRLFGELALTIDHALPAGPEKATALRKLLESKDAAVRAALDLANPLANSKDA